MKLIFCTQCEDVIACRDHWRACSCGRTSGRSGKALASVHVRGPGRVINLNAPVFSRALSMDAGEYEPLEAVLYPVECKFILKG